MELWDAIRNRRSCRKFAPQPVKEGDLQRILEAGTWAPSPANSQPWEFVILANRELKSQLHAACLKTKDDALQKSGWRWLGKYEIDFLPEAPLIVAVVGDPEKTGVDQFLGTGSDGYKYACAAAIQPGYGTRFSTRRRSRGCLTCPRIELSVLFSAWVNLERSPSRLQENP
jgi:nitroreductase